jgi:hypothetical protein
MYGAPGSAPGALNLRCARDITPGADPGAGAWGIGARAAGLWGVRLRLAELPSPADGSPDPSFRLQPCQLPSPRLPLGSGAAQAPVFDFPLHLGAPGLLAHPAAAAAAAQQLEGGQVGGLVAQPHKTARVQQLQHVGRWLGVGAGGGQRQAGAGDGAILRWSLVPGRTSLEFVPIPVWFDHNSNQGCNTTTAWPAGNGWIWSW